jgi:membrane protein implicated in regulation of membrane protease activity
MIDYFSANLWQLWVILAVVCLIMELMTGGFFIICFAIGALGAAIASLAGGWILQLTVFILVSGLSIFLVRPFALRYLHDNKPVAASNADAILGRVGRVSERIEAGGFGRVAIDGDDWKAQATRCAEDIPEGATVQVVDRESIIIDVVPMIQK